MYYVAEMFDEDYPIFCLNENGEILKFEDEEEAVKYAQENCQCGKIIKK